MVYNRFYVKSRLYETPNYKFYDLRNLFLTSHVYYALKETSTASLLEKNYSLDIIASLFYSSTDVDYIIATISGFSRFYLDALNEKEIYLPDETLISEITILYDQFFDDVYYTQLTFDPQDTWFTKQTSSRSSLFTKLLNKELILYDLNYEEVAGLISNDPVQIFNVYFKQNNIPAYAQWNTNRSKIEIISTVPLTSSILLQLLLNAIKKYNVTKYPLENIVIRTQTQLMSQLYTIITDYSYKSETNYLLEDIPENKYDILINYLLQKYPDLKLAQYEFVGDCLHLRFLKTSESLPAFLLELYMIIRQKYKRIRVYVIPALNKEFYIGAHSDVLQFSLLWNEDDVLNEILNYLRAKYGNFTLEETDTTIYLTNVENPENMPLLLLILSKIFQKPVIKKD